MRDRDFTADGDGEVAVAAAAGTERDVKIQMLGLVGQDGDENELK